MMMNELREDYEERNCLSFLFGLGRVPKLYEDYVVDNTSLLTSRGMISNDPQPQVTTLHEIPSSFLFIANKCSSSSEFGI